MENLVPNICLDVKVKKPWRKKGGVNGYFGYFSILKEELYHKISLRVVDRISNSRVEKFGENLL